MDFSVLKAAVSMGSEGAIGKNSEIFSLIIENTSEYIAIVDLAGKYIYVSPSHSALGYKPADLLGKNGLALVHPDDREHLVHLIAPLAKRLAKDSLGALTGSKAEPAPKSISFRFPDKSGNWHDIESTVNLVKNPYGSGYAILLVSRDVTERKKSEEKLRESEMRYRTLAENAEDIIFIIDIYGYVQYVNGFALRWLGSCAKDIIGKQIDGVFSPQDSMRMKENIQKIINSKKPGCFVGEFHFAKKDVWLSTSIVPVTGANGAVNAVFGIARDITSSMKSDEEMKKANERLTEAQRIANFGSWEWDIKTSGLVWSEQVYRLYGLDPKKDKPTYKTVIDTLAPECKDGFVRAIEGAVKNGKHFEGEYRIILPDGTARNTHTVGSVIRDKKGKPLKMFGVVQDITGRKKAEENLLKLKLGLERSTDAIFITDKEGKIIYVNPSFEKVYGYNREEALGKTPRIIKSGVIPAEQYKQFWNTLLAKKTVAGEIINKRKDGTLLTIDGSNNPIVDDSGKIIGFLAIHRDVTGRKKAEDELKRTNEELARFNQLAIGRELKMIELKKRIAELEGKK